MKGFIEVLAFSSYEYDKSQCVRKCINIDDISRVAESARGVDEDSVDITLISSSKIIVANATYDEIIKQLTNNI